MRRATVRCMASSFAVLGSQPCLAVSSLPWHLRREADNGLLSDDMDSAGAYMEAAGACMPALDPEEDPTEDAYPAPPASAALYPSPALPNCSSEEDHIRGSWVLRASGRDRMSFTVEDPGNFSPVCDKYQADWQAGGRVPPYDRYEWRPDGCALAAPDRGALCRGLDGQALGVAGDSLSQSFAHTVVGLMCGHVAFQECPYDSILGNGTTNRECFKPSPLCPAVNGTDMLELCGQTNFSLRFSFFRVNKYEQGGPRSERLRKLVAESDLLVLNWGAHYVTDAAARGDMEHFARLVRAARRPPRRPDRIFWRSSLVARARCSHGMRPAAQNASSLEDRSLLGSMKRRYHQDDILDQERAIIWPAMRRLGARILRTYELSVLRPDAYRVRGHNMCLDCLHFCEPGPVNAWVAVFFSQVLHS